jgi:hypothetical protein
MDLMHDDLRSPLLPMCTAWLEVLKRAREEKKQFQESADDCEAFFNGEAGFMFKENYPGKITAKGHGALDPTFQITINKVFEFVALYGAQMYHRNPVRRVTPRQSIEFTPDLFGPPVDPQALAMQDPMAVMQQQQTFEIFNQMLMAQQRQMSEDKVRAQLMETMLNKLPVEIDLEGEARQALDESLIKGAGVLWTSLKRMPSGQYLPYHEYDSVNNLLIDPDATNMKDAWWVSRKRCLPYWQVEDKLNEMLGESAYPRGSLKKYASLESKDHQQRSNATDEAAKNDRYRGETNDLLEFYEIYSKMGCGSRLKGVKAEFGEVLDDLLGDNVYLIICEDCPYPLNLPTDQILMGEGGDEGIQNAAQWPIPFYADDLWPCELLYYFTDPDKLWPIGPLVPGLPELKYLNTLISHMAHRFWTTSRDFIMVPKDWDEEQKKAIKSGEDQVIIEYPKSSQDPAKELVFVQQPTTKEDFFRLIDLMLRLFEQRVGLPELMYGMTETQDRSATETATKNDRVNVRPDHMNKCVERWFTNISRKEAFCMRWFFTPEDVMPFLGLPGAFLWQQYVASTDIDAVARELEYRVEESSAAKPNRNEEVASLNQAIGQFLPIIAPYSQAIGNMQPVNNLLAKWGRIAQLDMSDVMLPNPPPPPMPEQAPPPQAAA